MLKRSIFTPIIAALVFAGCSTARATPPMDAKMVDAPGMVGAAIAAPATPKATPAPVKPDPFPLTLTGAMAQGGMLIGRTQPFSNVILDDVTATADDKGVFVIGFDRDAPPAAHLRVINRSGQVLERTLNIEKRTFEQTVVNGLPPAMVTPPPETLARIKEESGRKSLGFASMQPGLGFTQPFAWPIKGRISSTWGAQRVLNGELNRPHYGVDIAAPAGTPIFAPADGTIAFAEPELYYEGGLIMLDHGQGLTTLYLHMSELDVTPGQKVKQGQLIGRVGNKGRTTGPHLCWRMKWRGRNLDPSLAVVASGGPAAPALLTQ